MRIMQNREVKMQRLPTMLAVCSQRQSLCCYKPVRTRIIARSFSSSATITYYIFNSRFWIQLWSIRFGRSGSSSLSPVSAGSSRTDQHTRSQPNQTTPHLRPRCLSFNTVHGRFSICLPTGCTLCAVIWKIIDALLCSTRTCPRALARVKVCNSATIFGPDQWR